MNHRPCGACGELVPYPKGCEHWRPATVTTGKGKMSGGARRKLAQDRAAAKAQRMAEREELYRQMGVTP